MQYLLLEVLFGPFLHVPCLSSAELIPFRSSKAPGHCLGRCRSLQWERSKLPGIRPGPALPAALLKTYKPVEPGN